MAASRLSSGSSASTRRSFAGPRQRRRGPPRPPSPGNGRLEIGPQAEPRENGRDGQGPAEALGRGRRVEPERSRGTRSRVRTIRRRAARCLRSRNSASGTSRRCRPQEGAAERSGLTRNRGGSGPSQHLALLALHPKTLNQAAATKLPTDTPLPTPWGSLFPTPPPTAFVHVRVIGGILSRVASSYALRTECTSLTKPCCG